MGYAPEDWTGKPVIAIVNTWSDLQPCHTHFTAARRGREARHPDGGRLPGRAAGASRSARAIVKPTTMMYRNMLAMETEELLRSHPVDGAVLMGGCDKTTPGLLLGATSMNIPAIFVPAGPMLRGNWQRQDAGLGLAIAGSTGTSCAPARSPTRTGSASRRGIARSHGTCMTMGTARDDDGDRRGGRHGAAGRLVDPRRRCRPHPAGARKAAGASSRWSGRT